MADSTSTPNRSDFDLLNCVAEPIIALSLTGDLLFANTMAAQLWPALATIDQVWQWPPVAGDEQQLRDALIACAEYGASELHTPHHSTATIDSHLRLYQGAVIMTLAAPPPADDPREMERHYRTIADFTYDWEYWVNAQGEMVYVSPSCARITGYAPEDFLSDSDLLDAITVPEDRAVWSEHQQEHRQQEAGTGLRYRIRRRDGEIRWIEHICQPVYDASGQFDGYRASNRDITQRQNTDMVLQASENRYRQIFENNQAVKLIIDPASGQIVKANSAAAHFYGYSREQLEAMRISDINTLSPADVRQVFASIRDGTRQFEFRHRLASGEIRDVLAYTSPLEMNGKMFHYAIVYDITSQKSAERALQESEARYRQIFENNVAIKLLIDPGTGRIVEANQAALDYYGYRLDEIQSMTIQQINTLTDEEVRDEMAQATAEKRVFNFRHRLASGEVRDVQVYSGPVQVGGHALLYSIVQDITAQKRAEKALRESEARYRLLARNLPNAAVMLFDQNLRYLVAEGKALANADFNNEVIEGRTLFEVLSPVSAARLEPYYRAALAGEEVQFVYRPTEHWYNVQISPIRDDTGAIEKALLLVMDVTEQRQLEARLRETEQRLRQIAENIYEIFWLCEDQPFHMLYVSPAFDRFYGESANWDRLNIDAFLQYVHPDDQAAVQASFTQVQAGVAEPIMVEYRIMRDNRTRVVRMRIFPILDVEGHVYRHAGVITDITEHVAAQQQSLELALQRERVEILADFVRSASHEFRTPLTLISTAVHLINRYNDPVRQREKLDQISDQVVRLTRLVDGLLALTKLDTQTALEWRTVSIDTTLQQTLAVLATEREARQVEIDYTPVQPPLFIYADEDLLGHALRCLVDNAMRFSPNAGIIHIATEVDDEQVSIHIRDEGPGIPQEHLPHIFERFYRGDKAHHTVGLGLGLSIAEQAVKLMDGHIDVSTTPCQGSTFTIRLPRR